MGRKKSAKVSLTLAELLAQLNAALEDPGRTAFLQDAAAGEGEQLRPITAVITLGDVIRTRGANEGDVVIQFGPPGPAWGG
jgi:hypothetical protein